MLSKGLKCTNAADMDADVLASLKANSVKKTWVELIYDHRMNDTFAKCHNLKTVHP